jgi:hypothetical protein
LVDLPGSGLSKKEVCFGAPVPEPEVKKAEGGGKNILLSSAFLLPLGTFL